MHWIQFDSFFDLKTILRYYTVNSQSSLDIYLDPFNLLCQASKQWRMNAMEDNRHNIEANLSSIHGAVANMLQKTSGMETKTTFFRLTFFVCFSLSDLRFLDVRTSLVARSNYKQICSHSFD